MNQNKISEALGIRSLELSIDADEGRDPNETTNSGYISDGFYEWMSKAWGSGEISHTEEFLKKTSERMKQNNPMKDPEIAKKVNKTILESYASGKRKPRKISNKEKQMLSERMKKNNPVHTHPEKHNFKNNSYVKDRKWYNNGVENIYIYEDQEIPEGFKPGMMYKPRKNKLKET